MEKYENIAREEGRKEGLKKGLEKGAARKVFEWVSKGKFTVKEGADDLQLSITEFVENMKNAGFKLPQTQ